MTNKWKLLTVAAVTAVGFVFAAPASAAVPGESQFIFNTLLFLMGGFLVMWMAAGFAMLESGLVRSKNVATICAKNIGLYSIAGIMYFLIGYPLMYWGVPEGGLMGTFAMFSPDDAGAIDSGFAEGGYSAMSDWFFQMVFVATAASIVSGTLAERIKLFPFFIFVVVLTGIIYPIQGSWSWGGGILAANGFSDFAGSTIVHSVGGWAALAGAIFLGARKGKYGPDGRVNAFPGSSMPLATLGTFILWLGWFGFNGASQLAMGSGADAIAISQIFANTNTAAGGGVVAAIIVSKLVYGKVDLTMALNGALAGLVSITAEPLTPSLFEAMLIGMVGGVLVVFAIPLLDKLKIDDVVGAISVHLVAGIWGTLAVPLTNDGASFGAQLMGIGLVGVFVFVLSSVVWLVLKATMGIRLAEEDEERGGDVTELGLEAYPEFGKGSQTL